MAPRKPISPATADRLERMARQSVVKSPAVKAPVVADRIRQEPPVDPNNPLSKYLGGGAAANVPGNVPFTGPTLDPEVMAARANLLATGARATAAGVPQPVVESIVSGEGDPNRGFLGPARWLGKQLTNVYSFDIIPGEKKFQPFVRTANIDIIPGQKEFKPIEAAGKATATLGAKALVAASPALDKLDFGRRFVTSTLKEVGDEVAVWRGTRERGEAGQGEFRGKGGFSASDWWKQLSKEGGISGGEFFADVKNPYVNQTLGFMADVFLDPVTYVSGPAGLGASAATRGTIKAGTRGGEKLAARIAAAEAEKFAAATARKIAEEALDDAIRIGDNVAARAAEDAIKVADQQLADAVTVIARDAPSRTYGRASNQALAEKVVNLRDEAQKVIDQGVASADEINYAERFVTVINDDVIKQIQSKGLAGIAAPFWDIVKTGARTPAQEILGVRGGLRIANPLNMFGAGPLRVAIPGTERFTNAAGRLVASSRLKLGNTPLGIKIINNITPTGDGGILGSADLLELRTGLRRGTLSPNEAVEATRLLQLDQQYRALVNNERKIANGLLNKSGLKNVDPKVLDETVRLRQVAAFSGVTPAFTPEQKIANDVLDKIFDDYYEYAVRASGATGYVPPRRANYFPQMQSDRAIAWAKANPKKAEELAKALKVDRTWFVGNFRARELAPGDEFFGKVLTQADIDGGATALNNIARAWGLKFDFFETDVRRIVAKYADKHAQFSALQKSIGALPETLPSMAARKAGADFVTPGVTRPPLPSAVGFSLTDPATGILLDPAPILQGLTEGELRSLIDEVNTLNQALKGKTVIKSEIGRMTADLQARIDNIEDAFVSGTITPLTASVATDEVVKLAKTALDEINGVAFNYLGVPTTRWSEYSAIVKRGFEILNDDIIDPTTGNVLYKGTAPDIAVTEELADLLRNATRMEDPQFAARVREVVNGYTRFSKTWLTARPGFHTRNAFSNVFQLIAAGADPRNLLQGDRILLQVNKGLKAGLTPRQIAEKIVDKGLVKFTRELFPGQAEFTRRLRIIESIEDAINYSGSTGFGQLGEISREVGAGNRGILQRGAPTTKPVLGEISRGVGAIPVASRKLGETIENYSRFGLMWDGISKGLSPAEAIARANKYLIDYADLSNVDRIAKQIIPFWTFMSRNAPLQMELMWTNPRAYAFYSNLKRNIEDQRTEEEGGLVIPSYEKGRGIFATKEEGFGALLPGDVIKPGLPFPGGGENVLAGLITEPKKFLANINPIFRAPVEAVIGKKAFTGGSIVPKEKTTAPTGAKIQYLIRELYSPTSPVAAVIKATPLQRNEFLAEYFGINVDDADPLTQEVNSLLSLLGLPFGTQRLESSVREIESRIYKLEDYINDKQEQRKLDIENQQGNQQGDIEIDPSNPLSKYLQP